MDFQWPAEWQRHTAYQDIPSDIQVLTNPEDWRKLISLRQLTRDLRLGVD